jgi:integrase
VTSSRKESRKVQGTQVLLEAWAAWLRGAGFKRESTALAYRRHLSSFIQRSNVSDFSSVGTLDLDGFVVARQVDGVGNSTIRTQLHALRSFFGWAHTRGHLPADPAAPGVFRIPPDDRSERPVFVLEADELERLFAVSEPPPVQRPKEPEAFFRRRLAQVAGQEERDRALVLVAYVGALRVSEAAALRWEDVRADGRDGVLRVMLRASKRSDHPATIHLDARSTLALQAWRRVRAVAGKAGPFVFGLSAAGCSETFERLARLAGIPKKHGRRATFHCLRSSRATHAAEVGATDRQIAALLRHRNVESITRYVRAATETRKRGLAMATLPWNASRIRARRAAPITLGEPPGLRP